MIKGIVTTKQASDARRISGMCKYLTRFIPNLLQASEQPLSLWNSTELLMTDVQKVLLQEGQLLT